MTVTLITFIGYVLTIPMSGAVARAAIPVVVKGLSRSQKLKYFKAGAWTSFLQEKALNYGYNKIRNHRMSYRSRSRYRSPYSQGNRSFANQYYSRRRRGGSRRLMNVSQEESMNESIPTIGYTKKILYDGKQKKVEVYTQPAGLMNTDGLVQHQIGSGISTGVDRGDRVADTIKLTHIRVEINVFNPNLAASLQPVTMRIFVLKNKRPSESNLVTNLFESNSDENTPVDWSNSNDPRQLSLQFNRNTHVVYMDKTIRVLTDAEGSNGAQNQRRVYYVKLPTKMQFTTSAFPSERIFPSIKLGMFIQRDDYSATTCTNQIKYQLKISTHYTD